MKISTRARYGLRGLFDIAYHNLGRPTHVKDIARRQEVTPRYLEQIFQVLKRHGLVAALRGPRGGYYLARPAEAVTVGDVVRATEGPIRLSGDNGTGRGRSGSSASAGAEGEPSAMRTVLPVGSGGVPSSAGGGAADLPNVTAALWDEIGARIEQVLDGVTLADLCTRGEAAGLPREADTRRIMYFI